MILGLSVWLMLKLMKNTYMTLQEVQDQILFLSFLAGLVIMIPPPPDRPDLVGLQCLENRQFQGYLVNMSYIQKRELIQHLQSF